MHILLQGKVDSREFIDRIPPCREPMVGIIVLSAPRRHQTTSQHFVVPTSNHGRRSSSVKSKGGHGPEILLTNQARLFPSMYGPNRASPRAKNLYRSNCCLRAKSRGKLVFK